MVERQGLRLPPPVVRRIVGGAAAAAAMATTFGPTTDAMSRAPVTMVRVLAGTYASCSALRSTPSSTTAASDTDQAAAPTEDGDAAEQDRRDDRQLEPGAVVGSGAGEP